MRFKLLLMVAAALTPQSGIAQSGSMIRQQMEGRYASLMAAVESKDEAALRAMFADGFVDVDIDGKSAGAAQMMKGLLSLPADPNRHWQITILSVRGDDRAAVVEQRYDMTTKVKDAGGIEEPATVTTLSTDNWVKENGSWLLMHSVMNRLDATVGGRPIVHKTNPTAR